MMPERSSRTMVVSPTVTGGDPAAPQLTPGLILSYLKARGLHENVLIHEQDYAHFLREKGVTELGRGGEGAVYFLRGHVVKIVGTDFTPALLREIAHMLLLNPSSSSADDQSATMGDRARQDLPGLLWVYTLSNGGLSVGMKPFDRSEQGTRGSTLHDRLHVGPTLEREHVLRALKKICGTLVYTQKKGLIHHDLKPANIYIPGDPKQDPVVFDLGQALWHNRGWGNKWLTHGHNLHYWYNGTYQYMHRLRRRAHVCALNIASRQHITPTQREAFSKFVPSLYDDVFAFAYIVRDVIRSKHVKMLEIDRKLLDGYYHLLMGMERTKPKTKAKDPSSHAGKTSLFMKVKHLFGSEAAHEPPPVKPAGELIQTMEQAQAKLDALIGKLQDIK